MRLPAASDSLSAENRISLDDLQKILKSLIKCCDHTRVCLKAALRLDQIDELIGDAPRVVEH